MTQALPTFLISAVVGLAFGVVIAEASFGKNHLSRITRAYHEQWLRRIKVLDAPPSLQMIPIFQALSVPLLFGAAIVFSEPKLFSICAAAAILPPIRLVRAEKKRREKFEDDLDGFLVSLADSLTAVPNLSEALASLYPNLVQPIRREVGVVLAEIRLGRAVDDALTGMAARIRSTGLDAAIGALILSRKVGGDIPKTLRRIAETLREMAHLEGVVKTKTAEGRTQAWVIGLMPPSLVLYFEKVNPEWLAPMWNDPIGWALLGAAAATEIAALVLIRKIMAVDI